MRSCRSRVPITTLLLVLAASSAGAQRPVFSDEITITATGDERPTDDVPLPVTVIDRQAIDDAQEASVAELLRRVPGLVVLRSGGDGAATSLFARGTESDHTLALYDGVRLNSPFFGGYDWSLLSTAGLERIEAARGPFSALWGADAVGGVVNLVPARARDGVAASLLGEAGGDGWRRLEGAAGYGADRFDLRVSAVDRSSDGELANSDSSARQLLVDAGWSWAEGRRVALVVQDLATELGVPFASPSSPTPNRRQASDQLLVAVPLRLEVRDAWGIELVVSQVERELAFSDPDDPFGFTRADTSADTFQARFSSRHELIGHAVSWGAEWRSEEVTDSSSYGVNLVGRGSDVASLFLQDVWQAPGGLQVIAGVRWDDADEWGSETSPRVAVGWRVAPSVELRAAAGRAFRQPSVGELYYPFSGNPELEAERSRSVEIGADFSPAAGRLAVSLFATRIDDLIDFDFATYAFANVAEARVRGVEGAWEMSLGDGLAASLAATWLDTEDAAGMPLLRRPAWTASATLHGAVGGRWRGDLTVLWVGARDDVDADTFARTELAGHLTADLAAAYALSGGLELTVGIANLADESYQEIAGYPAPGRRITGGLRWRL